MMVVVIQGESKTVPAAFQQTHKHHSPWLALSAQAPVFKEGDLDLDSLSLGNMI